MREFLDKISQKKNLTRGEMQSVMGEIMSGRTTEEEMKEFLLGINAKGPTVEEITGAAMVMRKHALAVEVSRDVILDTCGTGGDGKHTFNISTMAAFVVAACGVTVAKHGNRSVSSKCGSADLLEALGVNITMPHDRLKACLEEVGIAFLFAQLHHPAMKHVAPARRSLGVKTIFNVLGPLTNPAHATHQMMGVYSNHLAEQMVHVLRNLGSQRAIVVHGADGLDEITTTTKSFVSEFNGTDVLSYEVSPERFNIPFAKPEDLLGGDIRENALVAIDVLSGRRGPKREAVALNAGFALYAADKVKTPEDGVALAFDTIHSGRALKKLEELKAFTSRV